VNLKRYDYIVVGGGSAGCVLAARLSEDASCSVLLLEAGASEAGNTRMRMPLAWRDTFMDSKVSWGYKTEPEACADQRVLPVPRGKVLGGTASVNGMMYIRGGAADYDEWATLGCKGWSYREVLPYFKRAENNWRGASEYHGGDGPLTVARNVPAEPLYGHLLTAGEQLGFKRLDDFHGTEREGFSTPDFTVHNGERGSTVARYLRPAMSRANLEVRTEVLVHRVRIEQGRARGVVCEYAGETSELRCEREVLLAAGAIGSPQLLLLSGVGAAAELGALGIPVQQDLPGVGANLQEHQGITLIYDTQGVDTFDSMLRLDRLGLAVLRWFLRRTGPVAGVPVSAQGFVRTREGLDRPDLQLLVSPVSMMARPWFPGWREGAGHVLSVACVLLHPDSRGRVSLRSADPRLAPGIQLNLLQTETDRVTMRAIVRFAQRLFATPPLAAVVRGERIFGDGVQSDAVIDAVVRSNVRTAMHPTSTCAMGNAAMSVVDSNLQVRGVAGLRVIDASVMPKIVGGNTNAPVIMIAEKAVDLIKAA
jgi:choline dehydrogenase